MGKTDAQKNLEQELDACRRELADIRRQLLSKEAALAAMGETDILNRLIIDQLPAFVCLIRNDFTIAYTNPWCQELFGTPAKSLCYDHFCKKTSPCRKCLFQNDEVGPVTRLWNTSSAHEESRTFEITHRLLDNGRDAPILLSIGLDVSEHIQSEKILLKEKEELELRVEERTDELQRKNIALTEVLSQLEVEKQNLAEKVEVNVQKILLPVIEKLIEKSSSLDKRYLMLIKQNLQSLTSSAGIKLAKVDYNLTPKEIELCTLIKGGFSIKEIATMHNLSERTVETHRLNIRRKLGLTSAKINLSAYLSNL